MIYAIDLKLLSLKITTKKTSNTKGTFHIPVVQPLIDNDLKKSLLAPDDPRFLLAAECEKLVGEGRAKADVSSARQDGGNRDGDNVEDLPF